MFLNKFNKNLIRKKEEQDRQDRLTPAGSDCVGQDRLRLALLSFGKKQ